MSIGVWIRFQGSYRSPMAQNQLVTYSILSAFSKVSTFALTIYIDGMPGRPRTKSARVVHEENLVHATMSQRMNSQGILLDSHLVV